MWSSLTVCVELYLEHTEPASKEVGAHNQSPFDLPSSWPHKSTLFPVWYVSLLDSILHFPGGSAPCWISPSPSKSGLVLEPHPTACGVLFRTMVVFLAVMAQVCLPECWCYSCLSSFFSPTYFLTIMPIFSSSVLWLPGRYDQREPCRRREWKRKVRLGYLPSMLPWQNGLKFTAGREGCSVSCSAAHCSSPMFLLLSSYMVLFCPEMGSHQIAH